MSLKYWVSALSLQICRFRRIIAIKLYKVDLLISDSIKERFLNHCELSQSAAEGALRSKRINISYYIVFITTLNWNWVGSGYRTFRSSLSYRYQFSYYSIGTTYCISRNGRGSWLIEKRVRKFLWLAKFGFRIKWSDRRRTPQILQPPRGLSTKLIALNMYIYIFFLGILKNHAVWFIVMNIILVIMTNNKVLK